MLTSPPTPNKKDFFQIKISQMLDFDLKRCSLADNMESKLPKFITENSGMVSAQFQGESCSLSKEQPNTCCEPAHRREAGTWKESNASGQKRGERQSLLWVLAAAVTSCPQHHSIPCPDHVPADHHRVLHLSGCLDFS